MVPPEEGGAQQSGARPRPSQRGPALRLSSPPRPLSCRGGAASGDDSGGGILRGRAPPKGFVESEGSLLQGGEDTGADTLSRPEVSRGGGEPPLHGGRKHERGSQKLRQKALPQEQIRPLRHVYGAWAGTPSGGGNQRHDHHAELDVFILL